VLAPSKTGLRDKAIEALGIHDPTARMAKFLTLLATLTAADAVELRKLWQELILIGRNDQEIEPHVNRTIARILGAKVLEVRREVSPKVSWLLGAAKLEVEGAMVSDPQGVRRWYDSLTNEPLREALLDTYAASVAESNKEDALFLLNGLPAEFQPACGKAIFRRLLFREGFSDIINWLGSVMQKQEGFSDVAKKHLLDAALEWMAPNPAPAAQLAAMVEPIAGQSYVGWSHLNQLGVSFAKINRAQATAWAQRLADRLPGEPSAQLVKAVQTAK
jgi:hypothetical protein